MDALEPRVIVGLIEEEINKLRDPLAWAESELVQAEEREQIEEMIALLKSRYRKRWQDDNTEMSKVKRRIAKGDLFYLTLPDEDEEKRFIPVSEGLSEKGRIYLFGDGLQHQPSAFYRLTQNAMVLMSYNPSDRSKDEIWTVPLLDLQFVFNED